MADIEPSSIPPQDPPLSPQQTQILDRVLKGKSVFFTGSAGVGKSVLLRAIIGKFKERGEAASFEYQRLINEYRAGRGSDPDLSDARSVVRGKLGVTASTGAAAV